MSRLEINFDSLRYRAMIGVGGIGAGEFFLLDGNHTLGREESRSGRYLDTRDYCKLHIISHYVQVLLGNEFRVIPIGKVGKDHLGIRLRDEMRAVGISLDYIEESEDKPTLYSFCFLYPDGSGGNMTTNDSACAQVDEAVVSGSETVFSSYANLGIALAVPEVPLPAREKLLRLAADYGFFKIASFTSAEMKGLITSDLVPYIDLLAVNLHEAAALTGEISAGDNSSRLIEKTVEILTRLNPELQLSITYGREGSWIWDGKQLEHLPAHVVSVKNAAGAGDAHLAGIIAGLSAGLTLQQAHHLGVLTAAHAVTSPHTINPETNRLTIQNLLIESDYKIDKTVTQLLEERS